MHNTKAGRSVWKGAQGRDTAFMRRRQGGLSDRHDDPTSAMANLFDVAILIAVGFLLASLASMGLNELISKSDMTIVKNPGGPGMELITKKGTEIRRMRTTNEQVEGAGAAIGTVYRLKDGRVILVPQSMK